MGRARKKASPEWLVLDDAEKEAAQAQRRAHAETVNALISAAGVGLSPNKAAALVGISASTLKTWLEVGNGEHPTRKPTAQLERLATGWAKARSEFVVRNLAAINEHASGWIETLDETNERLDARGQPFTETRSRKTLRRDWKAAAWLLERSEPEEYGERKPSAINDKFQDAFATKVIEVDRIPGRRIDPSTDVSITQAGVDRPQVMLVPHITDAPREPEPEHEGRA